MGQGSLLSPRRKIRTLCAGQGLAAQCVAGREASDRASARGIVPAGSLPCPAEPQWLPLFSKLLPLWIWKGSRLGEEGQRRILPSRPHFHSAAFLPFQIQGTVEVGRLVQVGWGYPTDRPLPLRAALQHS